MDTTKFFNSKKRDLSNNSNTEEDAKRQREESPSESPKVSMLDTRNVRLQNLEKEVKIFTSLPFATTTTKLKEKSDLSESIKFMSEKFDEFEKERQEQKMVIEELRDEVSSLNEKRNSITKQLDRQEQYSRRNFLLINGINEGKQENTDTLALEIFREKLDIDLTQRDLDRTHRIGKNDKSSI